MVEEIGELKDFLDGPLTRVFGGPTARILDQAAYVGNMMQTVPMLAESTRLPAKTVRREMARLARFGLVKQTKTAQGARAYRFDVSGSMRELVNWPRKMRLNPKNTV